MTDPRQDKRPLRRDDGPGWGWLGYVLAAILLVLMVLAAIRPI